MGGRKVTGSLRNQLEDFWGHSTDKKFYQIEGIVSSPHFDSIWWLGLNGQFLNTQKLLAYSSQNRYLVEADVTPNCVGADISESIISARFNPANSCQLMVPLTSGPL